MTSSIRTVRTAILAGLLIARACDPASAASAEDRRVRGWTVAAQLCSQCHVIGREPQEGGFVGPSFVSIAHMPSTTGLALNVVLQSHHQRMPSLRLHRDEMDAVIDDILGLKASEPGSR